MTIDRGVTGSNPPDNTFWNLDFVRNQLFSLLKNSQSVVDGRGHHLRLNFPRALAGTS